MSQQFGHFRGVCVLSRLVEQCQQLLEGSGVIPHMADDAVQMVEDFFRIFRQQSLGIVVVDLQRAFELPGLHQSIREIGNRREVVVHREQLAGDGSGIGESSRLQVRLEQIAQAFGIRVQVRDLGQRSNGALGVSRFQQVLPLHQQGGGVDGVEREHAGKDFVGSRERAFRSHGLGRRRKNFPRFGFLSHADVKFRQLDPHGRIFRIHFQDLLEDAHRILKLTRLCKFVRHLQILGAGVIEKALLRVKFRQLQHAL